jgi:sugar phosphate permease
MKRQRIFYGWWIVAAGMGISSLTSTLFIYGFSAFFIPWRETFGWSRALLGGVVGLSRLEGGLIAPVAGWFIDKYGPRRMMFLGLGMMGIGFFALSRVNSLVMLYVVFIGLLAIGSSFGTNRPVEVTLANWFVRRRGRAMGLRTTGTGLGGSAVFLFALLIEVFGWRTAAMFAGVVLWGVGFPLAWVMRHKPEDMGLLPDGDRVPAETGVGSVPAREQAITQERQSSDPPAGGSAEEDATSPQTLKPHRFWMRDPRPEIELTVWQALRTRAFWWMALTYAIWASMPGITTVHIAPFLSEELGLDYLVALGALSFFVFASVFGRLSFGFVADYVNLRLLMAVLLVLQGIGIFLFSQVHSLAQVPFYVIIFAVPYGGFLPMRSVIVGYFFGRRRFGTIGGLLSFVDLPATVAAPIWVGWLADSVPGGYRIGFKIIAIILLVAAATILMTRRPRHPLPPDRPPSLLQAFRRR